MGRAGRTFSRFLSYILDVLIIKFLKFLFIDFEAAAGGGADFEHQDHGLRPYHPGVPNCDRKVTIMKKKNTSNCNRHPDVPECSEEHRVRLAGS